MSSVLPFSASLLPASFSEIHFELSEMATSSDLVRPYTIQPHNLSVAKSTFYCVVIKQLVSCRVICVRIFTIY
jgi:hypothetical protein